MEPLNDLVQQWRVASGADRTRVAVDLFKAVGKTATDAASKMGLATDDAKDVAQKVLQEFRDYLESGAPFRKNADAMVWWLAQMRALDFHKAQRRQSKRQRLVEQEAAVAPSNPPPLEEVFDRDRLEHQRAKVAELLASAPSNYRIVLQRHIFEKETLDDLAEEEFQKRVEQGELDPNDPVAVKRAQKKARNLIDKHKGRATKWLAKHLSKVEKG